MTGPSRLRLLSDDEIELWRAVAASVDRRPGSNLPLVMPVLDVALPAAAPAQPRTMRTPLPPYVPPQSPPRPSLPPITALERRYRQKVTRGRISIDRVMDLHGLTQAQAHGALRGFLRTAQHDGASLVLVVTGKGLRSSDDGGVLRRAVPHWLREPDMRLVVLGFEEASHPHGGTGALYIRLRRKAEPR